MDELFETFDAAGTPTGLVPRPAVHARGLWHRAVHVWLFAPDGRVWVQQRGPDKDINAGCWDVSVGEHLQPGETYAEAAHRGLREELGLEGLALEALGDVRRAVLDRPEQGIHDHELQQAWRAVYAGAEPPAPAADEVADLRLLAPAELHAWLETAPEDFTPGLRQDVADLGLLDAAA
ncbi:MAG: NUDIX domain-containing protein [Halofilum sp. (in: g-proteobacteria)]|nr:NUDIX domain-containing protein [Halofilum sp. (in: g-proteobacteria)]